MNLRLKSYGLFALCVILLVGAVIAWALRHVPRAAEPDAPGLAEERSLAIASTYRDLYANAEKSPSGYDDGTVISQEAVDQIEARLIGQGLPVANSDAKYPAYLENTAGLYAFWEAVCQGEDAEQELLYIPRTGELYYYDLQYTGGAGVCTLLSVRWDETGAPYVATSQQMEVLDWALIGQDDFYFQIYPLDHHYEAYKLVRLRPVDRALYDLTAQYLLPVGYLSNNLFVTDWSSEDFGTLSMNDLLEFFYRAQHQAYFPGDDFPIVDTPYSCRMIPAALFEDTILPYFDISPEEFRARCHYDAARDAYPWQEIRCDNVTWYPKVTPEVTAVRDNGDGTLTLTVHARCIDRKTDCLFAHELVVRPLPDGGFQYVSNRITEQHVDALPSDRPRLPLD